MGAACGCIGTNGCTGVGGGFRFGTPGIVSAVDSGSEKSSSEVNLWQRIGMTCRGIVPSAATYCLTVSQYWPGRSATGYLDFIL